MDENLTEYADSRISQRRRDFVGVQIHSKSATESTDFARISHKRTVHKIIKDRNNHNIHSFQISIATGCHSTWRNDLLQHLFCWSTGVILLGAMRVMFE